MAACYYADGVWSDAPPMLIGPASHAFWMASVVFDGARAFGGLAPDLDLHCARAVASARVIGLDPPLDADAVLDLCRSGIRRFPRAAELYVRPMFYAAEGFVLPKPGSTRFALAIEEMPLPPPTGFTAALSSFRRPARDMAPTEAKASCLYPNSARAIQEARGRGFDNAVMLDANGNVAELATSNLWIVKNGVAMTPAPNGTFLNGITRQRVLALLRAAGVPAEERVLSRADLAEADEMFSTGNYGKVLPVTRFEDRVYGAGPVAARARELYLDFALGCALG